MNRNGHAPPDVIDAFARSQADKALEAGRSAWSAVGSLTSEISGVREELRQGLAELRGSVDDLRARLGRHFGWDIAGAVAGEEHPWGRRAYDPEEEITETGTRVKLPVERLRRMEDKLRAIDKRERDAKLREEGADKLVKTWKKRGALAVAIATPVVGFIGWCLHWLLGR
jgi:hypothetical protein